MSCWLPARGTDCRDPPAQSPASRLPALPGWRAATLYRPADQISQIGGDFFDLSRAADGFTVVLGDVTGKGVSAAAVTALACHSTRTAALLGLSPSAILALLNRTLLDEPELSLLTVVCAHVSERGSQVQMTIASAGHPPPLRRRAGEHPRRRVAVRRDQAAGPGRELRPRP